MHACTMLWLQGVAGMLKKLKTLKASAKRESSSSNFDPATKSQLEDKVTFYQSAIYAYTVDERE